MKYYFPLHFDGNNRGCEGISKGTAVILNDYMTLQDYFPITLGDKIKKTTENFATLGKKKTDIYFKYIYRKFLKQITKEDIMISTGGDMLCYGNNMVITTNNILHERGVRTILWGCSMGEENYTKEKYETLKRFSLIYARESLTYEYFKALGLKNIVCFPDPAFVLKPEACELPKCFSISEVIGINLSPYVLRSNNLSSPFGQTVTNLFDYIISNTNLHILLIPHVLWTGQDDRIVAEYITSIYKNTNRVSVLDSNHFNYLQIRHIISQCKYFIGGRTHAVISAYSTCVPTMALGYSIKSKGIAKDLGMDDCLVIDTRLKNSSNSLMEGFYYMVQYETKLKKHLQNIMPQYIERTLGIKTIINNL